MQECACTFRSYSAPSDRGTVTLSRFTLAREARLCARPSFGSSCTTIASGVLFALGTIAGSIVAQPRLELQRSCASCRIEIEEVVSFQGLWDDGSLAALPASVSRFARTRWAVVDPVTRQLEIFDARGRHLRSTIRRGDGPGELSRPMVAFEWTADSTMVIDRSQARMSVFDPTGIFRRSVPFSAGAFIRVMFTPSGNIVAATRINSRERFGLPFHEFDARGVIRRSFGARADQKIVQSDDLPVYRTVRRTREDGSFWTVEAYAPRLQRWSASGEVVEDWKLPMPDFVPFRGLDVAAPGAEFEAIEETADGLLVLVMAFRGSRYREAFGDPRDVDGRPNLPILNWGRYMDSRIFVLDPSSRRIVATMDTETFVYVSLGEGLFWGIRPDGEQGTVAVLRIRVRR
jgi:hypothetical protein